MALKAAITIHRDRAEVEQRWRAAEHPKPLERATVSFAEAPGGRGTEIHVELHPPAGGKLVEKLAGGVPLATAKDDLRRFKQLVETGVVARSEAVPEGERFARKLKTHPAQPLDEAELEKAGA
jgi:uncharacterized membrane protein